MSSGDLTLGIETAVAGGSLSLCRGEEELATWAGHDEPVRAEDVLVRIQGLLKGSGVGKDEITKVVVSAGPGSFTGIRVGIATAIGLKDALQVELSSFSVLEAMAASVDLTGISAIPMGRESACAQRFVNGNAAGEPFNIPINDLLSMRTESTLLVHQRLSELEPSDNRVVVFGNDLATALIRLSANRPPTFAPPIFISRAA
jgi:tRNA threonylcarbamoyl adenosine modification protein YeaZ